MRMLDLFCGRFGWGKAFAARGWEVVGVDLVEPPEIPQGCTFFKHDVLEMGDDLIPYYGHFDFICASSPCEQFSVHGMKHFHPNPPYPELGIRLFEHTRALCEASGVPYVMENVRAAQQFVGNAAHHCGPFYLWGSGVPPLLNQGIKKGFSTLTGRLTKQGKPQTRGRSSGRKDDKKANEDTARFATIPPELANCVASYADALIRQRGGGERDNQVRA
jgi:hypothetical protein